MFGDYNLETTKRNFPAYLGSVHCCKSVWVGNFAAAKEPKTYLDCKVSETVVEVVAKLKTVSRMMKIAGKSIFFPDPASFLLSPSAETASPLNVS